MTSKNQTTLPKSLLAQVPPSDYFDVVIEDGRIILTPVRIRKADAVREKLEQLGINESDVADAVTWARHKA